MTYLDFYDKILDLDIIIDNSLLERRAEDIFKNIYPEKHIALIGDFEWHFVEIPTESDLPDEISPVGKTLFKSKDKRDLLLFLQNCLQKNIKDYLLKLDFKKINKSSAEVVYINNVIDDLIQLQNHLTEIVSQELTDINDPLSKDNHILISEVCDSWKDFLQTISNYYPLLQTNDESKAIYNGSIISLKTFLIKHGEFEDGNNTLGLTPKGYEKMQEHYKLWKFKDKHHCIDFACNSFCIYDENLKKVVTLKKETFRRYFNKGKWDINLDFQINRVPNQ